MIELFSYLFKFDFKNLFKTPTSNAIIQFFRYVFVGGVAFLVDAGLLFLLEKIGLHYLIATIFAFIGGLVCNYILSKLLVFQEKKANPRLEFLIYGLIGLIGLGLTEGLMYVLTDILNIYFITTRK